MSRTNDLTPPIDDTVELLTIAFDFGLILIANEIINSVISMAAATYSGIDNTPNNRFIGPPAIITSPKTNAALAAVSQQVGNMIAGVTYRLQCVVHTSLGNQPSLWTQFSCVATNVPTFVPIGGYPAVTTTVAGLAILFPSPVEGQTAYVTDAVSCVFGASVTGGGINVPGCPVHWDGAAWVAG